MGKIVAISDGEIGRHETDLIDEKIVWLSGKKNPKLLFLPIASHDAEGYVEVVRAQYARLGADVKALNLCSAEKRSEIVREEILSSDIVYVGGGNTHFMMERWKALRVNRYLIEAFRRGIVLSGLSAGAICWFKAGHSDSEFIDRKQKPRFVWVNGLGLLPFLHCPHFDEPERADFPRMLKRRRTDAVALQNCTALMLDGERYSVIKSNPQKKAFLFKFLQGHHQCFELKEGPVIFTNFE